MTTKEIAAAVNRSERTVQGWVKRLSERIAFSDPAEEEITKNVKFKAARSSPMIPADYCLDEVVEIIAIGLGRNAAMIYRMNAEASMPVPSVAPSPEVAADMRLSRLEGLVEKLVGAVATLAASSGAAAPAPRALPLPDVFPRDALRRLVEGYAREHGGSYHDTWATLYREYGYRFHRDLSRGAKAYGGSVLDYAEAEGQIGQLLALAYFLYGQKEACIA